MGLPCPFLRLCPFLCHVGPPFELANDLINHIKEKKAFFSRACFSVVCWWQKVIYWNQDNRCGYKVISLVCEWGIIWSKWFENIKNMVGWTWTGHFTFLSKSIHIRPHRTNFLSLLFMRWFLVHIYMGDLPKLRLKVTVQCKYPR